MNAVPALERVSLADLTVSDASPVELIESAAAAGFGAVGLLVRSATGKPVRHEIAARPQALRDIRAACAHTGVRVFDVEAFILARDVPIGDYLPLLALGAELGATHVSCIGAEYSGGSRPLRDAERVEKFAALCDAAARFGLHVGVEFMLYREIHTLGEALALIEDAGRPNAGVIVDALHLSRSGGSPDDVRDVAPHRIAYAQLCDAPALQPGLGGLAREARTDRLHLGDGALPLAALIRALPEDTQLVVETPVLADAPLPVTERVRNVGRKARAFLSAQQSR